MEGKKKSDETLQIRLYAVDCPEIAHFGNPAQPFSAEAKTVRLLGRGIDDNARNYILRYLYIENCSTNMLPGTYELFCCSLR